ncbi:MAG: septum formation inhibitor Maf [Flavobacteriaceae bacterium]|nr:septum formation inhibitor Maf [Flavobacteriaceae bacterium]
MKLLQSFRLSTGIILLLGLILGSCQNKTTASEKELALNGADSGIAEVKAEPKPLSREFKKYWYAGNAEITSYKLEQARYGELREGTSVLIYVTEPFLPDAQVKADGNNANNVPVLKLNATKKYLTGIYPYSIMSSTFYPVGDHQHAIKTSLSMQEWCGHIYAQLNNREQFDYTAHSYFEGEADTQSSLPKALLENEIWNKIRIDPEGLPTGAITIIPALEFFRLKHREIGAYDATARLTTEEGISTYTLEYEGGIRKLEIQFTSTFPHTIEGWTEEFMSGYGSNAKVLRSTGTKMKRLISPYWRQNSNEFLPLRDSLGL